MSSTGTNDLPTAGPSPGDKPFRVALLSTPRAGNNWLRYLLCETFGLSAQGVPSPEEVDWMALPPDFLLGLHWHPVPPFLEQLREHQFRPVVLARHPLDVLVSVLHFARH